METALTTILLSLPDFAVAAVDVAEDIFLFSPGFQLMLGDIKPRNLADLTRIAPLFDEEGGQPLTTGEWPLNRGCRGQVVVDLIAATQHSDGTWHYLRFNCAPLRAQDHTIIGAVALVQDVTAERRLRHHQADLRDRLIATINHYFRTPLSLVLGNAEVLEDLRGDLPTDTQRSIEALARGAKQLHKLTRAVSELVELDAAHDLDVTDSDVCECVQRALAEQQRAASEADVELRLRGPEHLVHRCDPLLVERAVGAVLRNAIQHGPAGSTITVTVASNGNGARVEVVDQGPGIPAQDVDRLLKPFETGDREDGQGLGLALADTIVTAHGGTLRLTPNDPTGLRVELTIPEPTYPPAQLAPPAWETGPPPGK